MSADKYLDPKTNPLIAVDDVGHGQPDMDDRAPFALNPQAVAARIAEKHPNQNELWLGQYRLVKMADGSFKVNDVTLAELPACTLLELLNAAG